MRIAEAMANCTSTYSLFPPTSACWAIVEVAVPVIGDLCCQLELVLTKISQRTNSGTTRGTFTEYGTSSRTRSIRLVKFGASSFDKNGIVAGLGSGSCTNALDFNDQMELIFE
jgi:hypothetical protein